jgi:hypothetical protein
VEIFLFHKPSGEFSTSAPRMPKCRGLAECR